MVSVHYIIKIRKAWVIFYLLCNCSSCSTMPFYHCDQYINQVLLNLSCQKFASSIFLPRQQNHCYNLSDQLWGTIAWASLVHWGLEWCYSCKVGYVALLWTHFQLHRKIWPLDGNGIYLLHLTTANHAVSVSSIRGQSGDSHSPWMITKALPIVLTIKPRVQSVFWADSPISL